VNGDKRMKSQKGEWPVESLKRCEEHFRLAIDERHAWNKAGSVDYSKIITIEPGKRSGKPCIRGMRITVQDILEYMAGGMTQEEILADFSELTPEDIRACLAFAANRERKLFAAPA
jgi:uncharacterized protein (DUF433 family)